MYLSDEGTQHTLNRRALTLLSDFSSCSGYLDFTLSITGLNKPFVYVELTDMCWGGQASGFKMKPHCLSHRAILSSPQEIPHNKCPRSEENVNLSPYDTFGAKVVSGPVAFKAI